MMMTRKRTHCRAMPTFASLMSNAKILPHLHLITGVCRQRLHLIERDVFALNRDPLPPPPLSVGVDDVALSPFLVVV